MVECSINIHDQDQLGMEGNMENMQQFVQQTFGDDLKVSGVLAVRKITPFHPVVDGFDVLLLVVTKEAPKLNYINHYSKDGCLLQERHISQEALQQWILAGENRHVIEWLLKGEICLDRDTFLESTRHRLLEFPREMRTQKLIIEFSHFLRRYLQCKQYLRDGQFLDAYANIMEALLHWAKITIIDQGAHPEVTVWQQIKKINPGIYKLYEEIISSSETVEQRVQLVLLACEFNVMSKMSIWCELLIRILGSRKEPFSPYELKYHPELQPLHIDMALVLRKLVKRGIIREVLVLSEADVNVDSPQIHYTTIS